MFCIKDRGVRVLIIIIIIINYMIGHNQSRGYNRVSQNIRKTNGKTKVT